MHWYQYVAALIAGAALANVVPHFVHGISGDPFPTPFARPPGKGLSSPTINVVWALFNLILGYALFRSSGISGRPDMLLLLLFFAGIALISIPMSVRFRGKQAK